MTTEFPTPKDRNGLSIYRADFVQQVEEGTGKTTRRGLVTDVFGEHTIMVRWEDERRDSKETPGELVVVHPAG